MADPTPKAPETKAAPAHKHFAGKTVKIGHSHWDPGAELPSHVTIQVYNPTSKLHENQKVPLEKLGNYRECIEDKTFLRVEEGKENDRTLQLPSLKEWLAEGKGKDLSPEQQRQEHTDLLKLLREECKGKNIRVLEPK